MVPIRAPSFGNIVQDDGRTVAGVFHGFHPQDAARQGRIGGLHNKFEEARAEPLLAEARGQTTL
ncbi:hypothetical protein CKO11_13650 [Rhodobacter sp. TJ_12]|nr:hypothetical protein [Rhodobacter sp. TJ_12]